MKRGTKISLLVVGGLLAVCLWEFFDEDRGVGVHSVWWLPPEARNITFIKNDVIVVAEFDIEREAFETWCAGRDMPLRPLGENEHHSVPRCLWLLQDRGVIPPSTGLDGAGGDVGLADAVGKELDAGDLFYEQRRANGGGYSIGYDVEEQRGYYCYNHH